jgi:hypothetical protein
MNKILIIVMLLPIFVIGQTPPKGTNTITITDIGFNQIASALLDSGFVIDKSDRDLGYIKTEYKPLCSKCVPQIYLNVRIKDSIATLTGGWRSNVNIFALNSNKDQYYLFPIQQEKSKVPRKCFEYMDGFAKAFDRPISYSKR